jgi:hypothetical protein
MGEIGVLSFSLTGYEFSAVYNVLSLGIASMLFTSVFLWVARDRVLPKYRMAVMVSATVTSIAAYHYFRMFDSFNHGYGINEASTAAATAGANMLDFGGANYNVG